MKNRYVYLVYCNRNPIVYGVYGTKIKALAYAQSLIKYRENRAKERGYDFGFYHQVTEDNRKENEFDKREKLIFSACLKIEDGLTEYTDNGCIIKVIRYPVL